MERLPYIDTLTAEVDAAPEATWSAVVAFLAGTDRSPFAHYARIVGCQPFETGGDWRGAEVRAGATVPGFAVVEARAPELLRLTGRHRFARYALTLELSPAASGTRISAETRASFPGVTGAIYRALVITSGGHRIAVLRMLRQVRDRATARRGRVGQARRS